MNTLDARCQTRYVPGMAHGPIGIFDSGVGGLTVWRALRQVLPHESICYLGDTARVPYGNKSPETVTRYSLENCEFLLARDVKLIVVACNTSSALSLAALQAHCSVPVVGVIEPGVRAALAVTQSRHIGVIGTAGTIASEAYATALRTAAQDVRVVSQPCPLFVPLAEEGWLDGDITGAIIHRYLDTMLSDGVDTLILGCTHYPLLAEGIQRVVGSGVTLVDSGRAAASAVRDLLQEQRLLAPSEAPPNDHYFVTDNSPQFARVAERILGSTLPHVELV